jgi:HTH-type transcriptional regulator/antitoxin HigA
MTKFSFNQAVPFEATHVGEVIKDELSARNMKQSELSELTGIQKSILNDVIKGNRSSGNNGRGNGNSNGNRGGGFR